jgi:hypothetical protein
MFITQLLYSVTQTWQTGLWWCAFPLFNSDHYGDPNLNTEFHVFRRCDLNVWRHIYSPHRRTMFEAEPKLLVSRSDRHTPNVTHVTRIAESHMKRHLRTPVVRKPQVKTCHIFSNITPCGPVTVNRRFHGLHRLHLQGRRVRQAGNQHEAGSKVKGPHGRHQPKRKDNNPTEPEIHLEQWFSTWGTRTPWGYAVRSQKSLNLVTKSLSWLITQ